MKKVANIMVFLVLLCQVGYGSSLIAEKAVITQFFSGADTVGDGEYTHLDWTTIGTVNGCKIFTSVNGSYILLADNLLAMGPISVSPEKTTNYRLVCNSGQDEASDNLAVAVENYYWHEFKNGATDLHDMTAHLVYELAIFITFSIGKVVYSKVFPKYKRD